MVKSLLIVVCAFMISAASLLSPTELRAQTTGDDVLIIVEIADIDAYSYGDIARDLKGNEQVAIAEACVPAHLVVFKALDDSLDRLAAFNIIKQRIAASSGLENVTLTEMSTSEFHDQCLAVRRGN